MKKVELPKEMKLIGLSMPFGDYSSSYWTELPEHFTLLKDFGFLYKMKKHKRNVCKDNLEPKLGMDLVVHDPYAKKYFYKITSEHTDYNKILRYFNDKNLYVLKDEYQPDEPEEEEEKQEQPDVPAESKKEDNDYILF